ncbi:hypothetical protein Tco_1256355 [Tanacetum coccineum]
MTACHVAVLTARYVQVGANDWYEVAKVAGRLANKGVTRIHGDKSVHLTVKGTHCLHGEQSSVNSRVTPKGDLATREHAHSCIKIASQPIAMTSSSMIRGDCINACICSDTENALYTHPSCTLCAASALDGPDQSLEVTNVEHDYVVHGHKKLT